MSLYNAVKSVAHKMAYARYRGRKSSAQAVRVLRQDSAAHQPGALPMSDEFELWDLKVEVVGDPAQMICRHVAGDCFTVSGEDITFAVGQSFSMYALAAILPLLPAKQRMTHDNDWMTTDSDIACPDPHCGARFRVTRTGKSTFRHSETTAVPLTRDSND